MLTDWSFFYVAIPAVMLVGIAKGGFGGSLGMLGTPIIALAISPIQAAAIMLPVLILMDIIGLINYRNKVNWAIIRQMLPGGLMGIAIGWATASIVSEDMVRLLVGAVAIVFALNMFIREIRKLDAKKPNRVMALFWGTVSGFTSFISHAGGPPYNAYTLPLKMDRMIFAGTGIMMFSIMNAVKLVPYFALGQFTADNLNASFTLMPVAILAVLLGVWLVKRVSQDIYYRLTYTVMFVIGLKLLWDGFSTSNILA
ncbi:MAG: sulfite exporter TauE/SafE family protein [Rhizobiaceae bacterium]|nr:sulfite exporter TauE/SafE family protein [Rhizobiaceae bacterium]